MSKKQQTNALLEIIDEDSYGWLEREAPEFISALRMELAKGRTPEDIYKDAQVYLGYQREAFAQRLLQSARHMERGGG